MSCNTRHRISLFLTGIILLINFLQAGITINHYTNHIHKHNLSLEQTHADCSTSCVHKTKKMADEICDGHFFHFMPQVNFENSTYEANLPEQPAKIKLFLTVKQFSSNYKHLFTTRGPPSIA